MKRKRGKPRAGTEVRQVYSIRLEPRRAREIRRKYGGPDERLTEAVERMYERLERS